MRDEDMNSYREIDTFSTTLPFSSGNQEQDFIGNRGIAKITLNYDVICFEHDACTSTITSTGLKGI